jgi:hypothetical protein
MVQLNVHHAGIDVNIPVGQQCSGKCADDQKCNNVQVNEKLLRLVSILLSCCNIQFINSFIDDEFIHQVILLF